MAHKDLLDFWKAKMLVAAFTIMPLLWMAMFGFMYPQTGSSNPYSGKISTPYSNIPIALVNEDGGNVASRVASQFREIASSTGLFNVRDFPNFNLAREKIIMGAVKGAVVIPDGFSEALTSGRSATITVVVDDANPQLASLVYQEATMALRMISDGLRRQILSQLGSNAVALAASDPLSIERKLLVGTTNTFQFLSPGFMALILLNGALSGLAAAVTREREQGTMDGVLIAPISRTSIIVGKVIAQTVRGTIQALMVLAVSMVFFGVRIYGSPVLMLLLMVLAVASFSGVGVIVTCMTQEQETAMMLMMLLNLPMIFLSGVVVPVEQLPEWLQVVGKMLPLYYAADGLRKVIALGADLAMVLWDIGILSAYALVTLSVAIPVFHKVISR
jgi:ABC-2 type transport system permease protein